MPNGQLFYPREILCRCNFYTPLVGHKMNKLYEAYVKRPYYKIYGPSIANTKFK